MGYIELRSDDWYRITNALGTSFGLLTLNQFVESEFPEVARQVAWIGVAHDHAVFEVVKLANNHGVLDRLLTKAAEQRPNRVDLPPLTYDLARAKPGWAVPLMTHGLEIGPALEALTSPGDPFFDTTKLAKWLVNAERRVCQVRCGEDRGTGFLVGADLVMTCYHVIRGHLKSGVPASDLRVRFDYRRTADGDEPPDASGEWIGIDPAWPIPNAPCSPADITLLGDPAPGELDFAILKLERKAGQEKRADEDHPRGWFDLSKGSRRPASGEAIIIVQHPEREVKPPPQMPLQITFATPGFQSVNANQTRIAYSPSTRRGSSGSPVFGRELDVVALHHNRGQIDPTAVDRSVNNRGIPIGSIVSALASDIRAMLVAPPDASEWSRRDGR